MVPIKKYYRYSELLSFECSTCCIGRFTGNEKEVVSEETFASRKWAEENGDYAHEYVARFMSTFTCSNTKCSETIFVTGIAGLDEEYKPGPHGRPEAEYCRVDHFRSKEIDGSGLGLSICREIARRHGGKIEIESKEAEGTILSVYPKGRDMQRSYE